MTDLTGAALLGSRDLTGAATFQAIDPATGTTLEPAFFEAGPAEVAEATALADAAFPLYRATAPGARAAFLEAIATNIESLGDVLIARAARETGLPVARLNGERARTTGQLRLFASWVRAGGADEPRLDSALPARTPLPRADLRLRHIGIGPVAVFGASNFPLAFSTAGGDTASALAAGCPVVVKGHPGHPGTGEIVADAIVEAIRQTGQHPGVFSLVQSNTNEAGEALVTHPLIKAIGFTGSLRGGRALFDLAMRRDEPIPFYGELGSVNPVFVLPEAAKARGSAIAKGWAASLTLGAGQFCTNPGIVVVPEGQAADDFERDASESLATVAAQTMLTRGIAEAFRKGAERIAASNAVRTAHRGASEGRNAAPALFVTDGDTFIANPELGEEVFGPLGIMVRADGPEQMVAIAEGLHGQLTATLQLDPGDMDLGRRLVPVLERKAGRILANGFPTGVEVADAMMHGGPYPASTNASSTSVGTLAIRRFLRPVAYQDMPAELLPADLRP